MTLSYLHDSLGADVPEFVGDGQAVDTSIFGLAAVDHQADDTAGLVDEVDRLRRTNW